MDLFLSHIFFLKIQGFHSCLELNGRKYYTPFLKCKNSGNIHLGIGYSIGILKVFKLPILFIPVFL